jgi:hypothetical protein
MTLLAGPAWADCAQEIEALDETIVAAETGAAPQSGGLPATEHQEEVLSGDKEPMETAAGATGDVEAASPHQRQVTREVDDDTRAQASELVAEARVMAQAGDEEGCMAKVTETKELLGTN